MVDVFICYINSYIIRIHVCMLCRHQQSKEGTIVMAVRSPSGKTFPGNFTIIPSANKWVFHAIYRLAFLSLYGEHICSLN
jgi:hypothetical protein